MVEISAHKSIWQTTDAMIVITLLLSFILDKYILELSKIPLSDISRYSIGGILIFLGVFIIILAKKSFAKEKQPSGPGKPTTKLVIYGIFKYSRNPLYLGIIITLIGIGFVSNNLWLVILAIPLSICIQFVLIVPEEEYLLKIFGEDYKSYLKNVRRWL